MCVSKLTASYLNTSIPTFLLILHSNQSHYGRNKEAYTYQKYPVDPEIHVICAMFEEIDRFSSMSPKLATFYGLLFHIACRFFFFFFFSTELFGRVPVVWGYYLRIKGMGRRPPVDIGFSGIPRIGAPSSSDRKRKKEKKKEKERKWEWAPMVSEAHLCATNCVVGCLGIAETEMDVNHRSRIGTKSHACIAANCRWPMTIIKSKIITTAK